MFAAVRRLKRKGFARRIILVVDVPLTLSTSAFAGERVAVNDTVLRCSAGAAEHVKIAKVTNVNDAINYLKSQNVYVYCADMDGEPMYRANLTGAIALLVGGEDSGVKRLSRELADGVISIPMSGKSTA